MMKVPAGRSSLLASVLLGVGFVVLLPATAHCAITGDPRAVYIMHLGRFFWDLEWRTHPYGPQHDGSIPKPSIYPADRAAYEKCLKLAQHFLDATKVSTPADEVARDDHAAALYIAAISASTLGRDDLAAQYIARLLQEAPDYIALAHDEPNRNRPAAFDLEHLLLWHRSRLLLKSKVQDKAVLVTLQEMTEIARASVEGQAQWQEHIRKDIASHPSEVWQRYAAGRWREAESFVTPEQQRAAQVPSVEALLRGLFAQLIPAAIRGSGAGAVRQLLEGMAKPGQPFIALASTHLAAMDRVIIAGLKRDTEAALRRKDYDKARSVLRQLQGFGKQPEVAQFIEASFTKVALGYKAQADVAFNLNEIKPQTKALASFRKMLEVAEAPLMKGYAHFRIADALGSMGKYTEGIQHLKQAITLWKTLKADEIPPSTPRVPNTASLHYIEAAEYFLGFYTGAGLKHRPQGIALQQRFVAAYPHSKWVEEALWDCLLWSRWSGHKEAAAGFAKELIAERPHSKRAANARELLKP